MAGKNDESLSETLLSARHTFGASDTIKSELVLHTTLK